MASSTTKKIQKTRHRCGGGGLWSSGIPRPSGAGATRQPPLSCGIGPGGTSLSPSRAMNRAYSLSECLSTAGLSGQVPYARGDVLTQPPDKADWVLLGHPHEQCREAQLVDDACQTIGPIRSVAVKSHDVHRPLDVARVAPGVPSGFVDGCVTLRRIVGTEVVA